MAGQPIYVTQTSSGPGPWQDVEMGITPQQISWSLTSTAASPVTVALQVTYDNPFVYGSSYGGAGGLAVLPSTAQPAAYTVATLSSGTPWASPSQVSLPSSMTPIYAWRLNETVTAGPITATALQAGKKQ